MTAQQASKVWIDPVAYEGTALWITTLDADYVPLTDYEWSLLPVDEATSMLVIDEACYGLYFSADHGTASSPVAYSVGAVHWAVGAVTYAVNTADLVDYDLGLDVYSAVGGKWESQGLAVQTGWWTDFDLASSNAIAGQRILTGAAYAVPEALQATWGTTAPCGDVEVRFLAVAAPSTGARPQLRQRQRRR